MYLFFISSFKKLYALNELKPDLYQNLPLTLHTSDNQIIKTFAIKRTIKYFNIALYELYFRH